MSFINLRESRPPSDPVWGLPNLALFVMECAALSVGVFLHYDYGQRRLRLFHQFFTSVSLYIGFMVAGAYFTAVAGTDAELLGGFFLASMAMASVQAIAIYFRGQEGRYIHSYYDGTPRLKAALPFLMEWQIKRYVEPVLIFALGWIVLSIGNAPLGAWLCFAALSQAGLNERARALWQKRVLDLLDEGLLGQWLNEETRHDMEGSETNGIETWGVTYVRPEDLPEAVARPVKAKKPAPAPEFETEPHGDIFSRLSSDTHSLLDRFNDDAPPPSEPETERIERAQPAVNSNTRESANGKRSAGRPRKYNINDSASV